MGIAAPAGSVDSGRLAKGVAGLESLGLRVRVPEGILARTTFTAGPVERRRAELQALLDDPEVRAVFCARGGAGSYRLVERLDLDGVVRRPKPFIGYSDVTALHLALGRRGLVTCYGPLVAWEFADGRYHEASLRAALMGEGRVSVGAAEGLRGLRPGSATGRLRGGCLSLLAAASGTPWALDGGDDEDRLLFLEDVDEPPYRIDRMLAQLQAAGAFRGVRGIVLGEMKGCAAGPGDGYALADVIADALADLPVPAAMGLACGHADGPGVTLPLGIPYRLTVEEDEVRLVALEPAVAP